MQIGFITSNKGKLNELSTSLKPLGHEVVQVSQAYPEVQVDTIDEVAQFGLQWILNNKEKSDFSEIFEKVDYIILEDSGLFVHALNNFPGVYSKFVFSTIGMHGVLGLLRNTPKNERSAHFESCLGVIFISAQNDARMASEDAIQLFKGTCDGMITIEPRGEHGFGFDPIFQPIGEDRTFAEMKTNEKNQYSHRSKAISKFVEFLGSS